MATLRPFYWHSTQWIDLDILLGDFNTDALNREQNMFIFTAVWHPKRCNEVWSLGPAEWLIGFELGTFNSDDNALIY